MSNDEMNSHVNLSDLQFLGQFRNCRMEASMFSHEAHLRLAWLYLERYEDIIAYEMIRADIMNFVEHHGAIDKYHDTLTIAAVKVVEHFKEKSEGFSFSEMIFLYPRLMNNFRGLILSHYSQHRLNSTRAKNKYQKPDLVAF